MIFGVDSLYIWVAVIIIGVAVEAFSLDLSAIWFAVGGVAALIAASIGLEMSAQLVIFVLFSAVLLLLVRPFCRRFLKTKKEATNADRIIGQSAIVTEGMDNIRETGAVRISGNIWTALSADDSLVPQGAMVEILEIRGVKVIVKRLDKDSVK